MSGILRALKALGEAAKPSVKTEGLLGRLLDANDIQAKTDAEQMAKKILILRQEGRANEVTDEMMDQADPQILFKYTPLSMDEASRMDRAVSQNFNPNEMAFHGTKDDPERFSFDEYGRPVYTSDNSAVANTYVDGEDSAMFDLLVKQGSGNQKTLSVDAEGNSFSMIDPRFRDQNTGQMLSDFFDNIDATNAEHFFEGKRVWSPVVSTDNIADAMLAEGVPHARVSNVMDRGPYSPRAHPIMGSGVTPEIDAANRQWVKEQQSLARKPSTDQITFDDGGRLRSRYARFDPEFSHLRNLTASGLLGYMLSEEDWQNVRNYLDRAGVTDG